ncbi:MAG: hypothetical protein R3B09_29120 [Nannocystaceae bacterium]
MGGLLLLPGCFAPILDTTTASATATDTAATTTSTEGSGATTAESTSTTTGSTGPETTVDGDVTGDDTTTTTTTTTGDDGGLLCGTVSDLCGPEPWEMVPCEDPCPAPPAVGSCVLHVLGDKPVGAVTIERCDPECRRVHVAIRGSGTAEILVQTSLLGPDHQVTEVLPPEHCELVDPDFFTQCQGEYSELCADPATWWTKCVAFVDETCPIHEFPP